MIHYQLRCDHDDEFEGWFASIAEFERQAESGLIECPHCHSTKVERALMAPSVQTARGKEARSERAVAMAMAKKVREHIRDNFDYVGENFADEARKIHTGESDERPIWGEATPDEARALAEEGVAVAPLPPEIAPTAPKKLN
jgi:hypothetical protein